MLDLSPLWVSLKIATIATAIVFVLGITAANFMHSYRGRWRSLLDGLFLAPMVLPPTVLGFLLLLLFGKNGPLGMFLGRLGVNVVFTGYAAVITATVVAFPLLYKTVLGSLQQIDGKLQQAARTLGASELRLLWRVTLPLAFPGIVAGVTLAFARALGEFGATLMLAGNIPGKTQTLPMAIYFAVQAGAFREAAAWSSIMLAIALGGLALAHRWSDRQHSNSRVKKRGLQCPRSRPFPSVSTSKPSLSVTLRKSLPGFSLDVSFSTDDQPLGLLGASGAGKSLILRCIAGVETPDAGRIVLNGRVLFDSDRGIDVPSRDRRVGVLFQNYALFPHLSVAQNIAFGLPGGLSVRQQRQIVEALLVSVQLQGMGNRPVVTLSGGQQQRVALARVLASQPEVLLLDEPFSALDTHLRATIERDLQLQLEQFPGITLLVTHNIEEAYRLCHNLLVMDGGRISVCDRKQIVLERPETVSAARLTGCKNISHAVAVGASTVCAVDWNCTLQVRKPIPKTLTHVGVRAHQLGFLEALSPGQIAIRQAVVEGGWQEEEMLETVDEAIVLHPQPAIPNTFPCWLAMTGETPHRMTLYLKLNEPPSRPDDYHLQAEVFKAKWEVLKEMPFPWSIAIDPERLMLLSDAGGEIE